MTYTQWFGLYLLLHLPALFLCYWAWIQHERGGWWKVCHVFGILGYLPDVVANYTTFALIFWRMPSWSDRTFSNQLGNLILDVGWRGKLARPIAAILNKLAPSGVHIKAAQ